MAEVAQLVELCQTAAWRRDRRREHGGNDPGDDVTVFLYSASEAAALVQALDQATLDRQQQALRDELASFFSIDRRLRLGYDTWDNRPKKTE